MQTYEYAVSYLFRNEKCFVKFNAGSDALNFYNTKERDSNCKNVKLYKRCISDWSQIK